MSELWCLTTLWASTASYGDNFNSLEGENSLWWCGQIFRCPSSVLTDKIMVLGWHTLRTHWKFLHTLPAIVKTCINKFAAMVIQNCIISKLLSHNCIKFYTDRQAGLKACSLLTMLDSATLFSGTTRVTLNVALMAGSSQHGKQRLASVGSNWVTPAYCSSPSGLQEDKGKWWTLGLPCLKAPPLNLSPV
jgi:hypothetical protein